MGARNARDRLLAGISRRNLPSCGLISVPGQEHPAVVELETVFETLNAAEAQLIRSRLEAAGIETEMDPEFDPLSVGGFSTHNGGIRIKVEPSQAAEAKAILAAGENAE